MSPHPEAALLACPHDCRDDRLPAVSGWLIGTAAELQVENDVWAYAVRCWCGAQGPERPTEAEAITAWNQRASSPSKVGTGDEIETVARDWLEAKVLEESGCDPNDRDYGTDDMVDAFMAGAALALRPSEPELREALDWFGGQRRLELYFYAPTYGDDDDLAEEWRVDRVTGVINDREWETVGRGATPIEAIQSARQIIQEGRHNG